MENAFRDWSWSRAGTSRHTVVLYETRARDLSRASLALQFTPRGNAQPIDLPQPATLPPTGWRIARHTRVDAGHQVRVVKTLENAPFYSRSVLDTYLLGARGPAMHESLNLDRFRRLWVQCLLPFRMPRVAF